MEMHPNPDKAMSDGAQSLFPDQFEKLVEELRIIAPAVGRRIAAPVAVAEQVSV
jgi:3-deoxy-7-phosphoheptulonate synthase